MDNKELEQANKEKLERVNGGLSEEKLERVNGGLNEEKLERAN